MGIDPSDANMYGNYAAANLPKHIVKLTKNADNTYTIGLMGKYAPATVAQSKQVTATAEAGTYTVVIPAIGYAAFQADTENNMSVLHCAGGGSIVGWETAAAASQWQVADAESIQLAIGETGYATAYLPFPATPAGVYTPEISKTSDLKVYTASLETNERGNFFLGMNELEGTIPEATPVILKATPDTYVFNIGEGEEVVPEDALKLNETEVDASNALVKGYAAAQEENVLKGTFAPIEATGKYVLAKPTAEDPIGFYLANGGTIAAGKAYLELDSSVDVKALFFDFGGEATGMSEELRMKNEESKGEEIYNLAGQRLNKAQKGINIVNGKKILF